MFSLRCILFGHLYSKINCLCVRCLKAGHRWERCRCKQCKVVNENGHQWAGCKCEVCGQARDEAHDWQDCRCKKCKRTRAAEHRWVGCVCSVCGSSQDQGHDWEGCRCKKCKRTRDAGHLWAGCQCERCSRTQDQGHSFSKAIVCGGGCSTQIGARCKCGKEEYDKHSAVRTVSTNERGESEGQAPSVGYCCHACANRALNESRSARSKTSCSDGGTGSDGFRVISFYSFYE